MGDTVYAVFSAICVVFNIAPLCWQIEHNNAGPACLGFWVIILNFFSFVNAVVWFDDAIDRAPVLCDISVKIFAAAPIAILCANLCVLRFLTQVLRPSAPMMTARDRRRVAIYEYLFCFTIPIFIMATQILYQPVRYGIFRAAGCTMAIVLTWPTYVCFLMWAPMLSSIGCLLSLYVLYRLFCHRRDFRRLVNNASSALTTSRFIRLALLAICSFGFNLPLSIHAFVEAQKVPTGYVEYDWKFIHEYFDTVLYNPFNQRAPLGNWSAVISGILIIVFFGFGGEAMSYYIKIARFVRLGRAVDLVSNRRHRSPHSSPVTEVSLKDNSWSASSKAQDASSTSLHTDASPFSLSPERPLGNVGFLPGVEITRSQETV